jgi:large subunit ribosomal protein L4
MKAKVYNMSGKEVDLVELPSAVFEAKINRDLMHQALVRQMSNARRGTHKAKGRSEITKSTAKIYRQRYRQRPSWEPSRTYLCRRWRGSRAAAAKVYQAYAP